MLMMQDYLDLTRDMMLAFGAVFELPLLILFLSMVGMVTHRGLWKFNRWFVVIAFIIGAILTPSPGRRVAADDGDADDRALQPVDPGVLVRDREARAQGRRARRERRRVTP